MHSFAGDFFQYFIGIYKYFRSVLLNSFALIIKHTMFRMLILMNKSNTFHINSFQASLEFCHVLSFLLMHFGSLYCKQYETRSDCSNGSSMIRVHIVCFKDKIYSEVNLNIFSRCNKKTPYWDKKYWLMKG